MSRTPDEVLTFRQFIAEVNPKFKFYPHLDSLIAVLQQVADGEITRLMVFMPPRHGKSETVSRLFTRLAHDGVIAVKNKEVHILDFHALCSRCGETDEHDPSSHQRRYAGG